MWERDFRLLSQSGTVRVINIALGVFCLALDSWGS